MTSLAFNVGFIWSGCCPGTGTVGKHGVGFGGLEHPCRRGSEMLKVSRVTLGITDIILCVLSLISILPLRNQGKNAFRGGMHQGKIWLCNGSDRLS